MDGNQCLGCIIGNTSYGEERADGRDDLLTAAELDLADDESLDPVGEIARQGLCQNKGKFRALVAFHSSAVVRDSNGHGVKQVTGLDVIALGTRIKQALNEFCSNSRRVFHRLGNGLFGIFLVDVA